MRLWTISHWILDKQCVSYSSVFLPISPNFTLLSDTSFCSLPQRWTTPLSASDLPRNLMHSKQSFRPVKMCSPLETVQLLLRGVQKKSILSHFPFWSLRVSQNLAWQPHAVEPFSNLTLIHYFPYPGKILFLSFACAFFNARETMRAGQYFRMQGLLSKIRSSFSWTSIGILVMASFLLAKFCWSLRKFEVPLA